MWEYELAKKLKDGQKQVREKAVSDASFYIGTLESLSPVTVSAMGGEMMLYAGENLYISKTFAEYSKDITFQSPDGTTFTAKRKNQPKTGQRVLIAPIDGVSTMALIDLLEE